MSSSPKLVSGFKSAFLILPGSSRRRAPSTMVVFSIDSQEAAPLGYVNVPCRGLFILDSEIWLSGGAWQLLTVMGCPDGTGLQVAAGGELEWSLNVFARVDYWV